MKKTIIICSALLALAACNSCNTTSRDENSGTDFEEARVIASATFGPDDTPDSIEVAIKAADLPMHIEWDCDGKSWIAADCDKEEAENRMQVDFLIQKEVVTSRHNVAQSESRESSLSMPSQNNVSEANISPIEVKSRTGYTLTSIQKCIKKFGQYLSTPYVLHTKYVELKDGLVYLPLYMTGIL